MPICRLGNWAGRNLVELGKKHRVLQLGRNIPMPQYVLGVLGAVTQLGAAEQLGKTDPAGHQAEPESVECKGGRCPGLHYAKECQQARNGDTFPLSSIGEATPGALHPVLGFSAQEKGTGHTGVLRRVRKVMKELEHLTHKEG